MVQRTKKRRKVEESKGTKRRKVQEEDESNHEDTTDLSATLAKMRSAFFTLLKCDKARCLHFTGEKNFVRLRGLWTVCDTGGLFSDEKVFGTKKGGRPKLLTPFESWVCGLVLFKRFRLPGMNEAGATMLGLSDATARSIYEKFCIVMSDLSYKLMPYPTFDQLKDMTSAPARARFNMSKDDAELHGDCTKRDLFTSCDSRQKAETHSMYYNGTTLKYVVACSGNTYVLPIPPPVPGPTTDDAIHEVIFKLYELIPNIPDDYKKGFLAYVYDKGLVDVLHMEKAGIHVITPDTKARNQTAFTRTSAKKGKDVAVTRIHIERLNMELKQYSGFSSKIYIKQIWLSHAEANTARFFVNMRMCAHDYACKTCTWAGPNTPDTDASTYEIGASVFA